MLVGELSSSAYDQDLQISDDGRHAIFSSQRDPDFKDELYEAFR